MTLSKCISLQYCYPIQFQFVVSQLSVVCLSRAFYTLTWSDFMVRWLHLIDTFGWLSSPNLPCEDGVCLTLVSSSVTLLSQLKRQTSPSQGMFCLCKTMIYFWNKSCLFQSAAYEWNVTFPPLLEWSKDSPHVIMLQPPTVSLESGLSVPFHPPFSQQKNPTRNGSNFECISMISSTCTVWVNKSLVIHLQSSTHSQNTHYLYLF